MTLPPLPLGAPGIDWGRSKPSADEVLAMESLVREERRRARRIQQVEREQTGAIRAEQRKKKARKAARAARKTSR